MNRQTIEQTLWQEFFPNSLSKGEERKAQIVEAAISIIAQEGADALTFDRLAKKCKVTRQLIIHYFPDRTDLIRWGTRFVRAHMQNFAVAELKSKKNFQGRLDAYIRSTFSWIRANPQFAAFWLYHYYQCAMKEEFAELNSELVEMGHKRIESLIIGGVEAKEFRCKQTKATAKIIQNIITGSLVSYLTEDYDKTKEQLEAWTLNGVWSLLGLAPKKSNL